MVGASIASLIGLEAVDPDRLETRDEFADAAVVVDPAAAFVGLVFAGWEGLKAGLVTFGGAYTVIPYVHDATVDGQHWLTEPQFVDGLAMSGVLPSPLIIFSTFVGYIAGGLGGGLAITVGIFIPAFVFPIFFHRWLVAVAENRRIRPFLLGVAAGVIGLIAAVTVDILDTRWLSRHSRR